MKILIKTFSMIILAASVFCGCSKESPGAPAVDYHAFDAAPPEIKQMWDAAMLATTNNDPAAAIPMLRMMSRTPITQEQQKTVFGAIVVNENKLREKAKAGDQEALKAMESFGVSMAPQ